MDDSMEVSDYEVDVSEEFEPAPKAVGHYQST